MRLQLLAICLIYPAISAKNILFILPIATKSHKNVFDPLIEGLAARGHDITVVGPANSSNLPANVHEIVPMTVDDFIDDFLLDPLTLRRQGKLQELTLFDFNVDGKCERVYQNSEFRKIFGRGPGYFDLIFFNGYFNQCFFGLHHHLQAPFIIVTTMAAPVFLTRLTGSYYPTSYVPFPFLGYSDTMTFPQRLFNWFGTYFVNYLVDRGNPAYEAIYRKYLGQDTPGLADMGKNVSLIFGNEHYALTYPKPNLPDTIPVGGMYCRPAKPLPTELDAFLSAAEHGFIYVSLGSIITSKDLTVAQRTIFVDVFSRLQQRVIWKWDVEIDNLPPNVRVGKWLPQQDILGHPKLKLFITHGGLLSTQEAAYHGVPLIGLPIFVDQDLNMLNAVTQGYALKEEILELDEKVFEGKVRRILDEPRFSQRAKELSAIFRDEMETPLERAIFWSEYVMRHKGGAVHLRSAARQLNFFQLHSWDVIGFLTALSAAILYVLKVTCVLVFRRCCKKTAQLPKYKVN